VAGIVVLADRRFRLGHGRAFAVYVAGYTLGRFFIELLRTDPATRVFGDIRINVVVAAVVFLGAVTYLVVVRKPREEPPFTRKGADAVDPADDAADDPADDAFDDADDDHAVDPADPDPADAPVADHRPTADRPADDHPADGSSRKDPVAHDRPADDAAREPVPADATSGGGPEPVPDRTP